MTSSSSGAHVSCRKNNEKIGTKTSTIEGAQSTQLHVVFSDIHPPAMGPRAEANKHGLSSLVEVLQHTRPEERGKRIDSNRPSYEYQCLLSGPKAYPKTKILNTICCSTLLTMLRSLEILSIAGATIVEEIGEMNVKEATAFGS